jgi:hypothetical protein
MDPMPSGSWRPAGAVIPYQSRAGPPRKTRETTLRKALRTGQRRLTRERLLQSGQRKCAALWGGGRRMLLIHDVKYRAGG